MRSPQLQSAIEQVYAEFHGPKPRTIEGCPCCTDPASACRLLAKDLRQLAPKDLSQYAASVLLTMGDERDFNHFLPRLLEIASGEDWWPPPPVLLEKLKLAHWHNWPQHRRAAVKQVIDLWFADCLDADHEGADIDDLLCGIARADLPLDEYLDILGKRPEDLHAFFDIHAPTYIRRGRLGTAFWKTNTVGELAVLDFFSAPAVQDQIDRWL
ncbi:MAG: hypothetical protein SGI91_13195 [Alphaproteobacteria bacterium]|jgi:hypothetical protein|nr:hypothetical protein [Alphaproteobacteria bacterium]